MGAIKNMGSDGKGGHKNTLAAVLQKMGIPLQLVDDESSSVLGGKTPAEKAASNTAKKPTEATSHAASGTKPHSQVR